MPIGLIGGFDDALRPGNQSAPPVEGLLADIRPAEVGLAEVGNAEGGHWANCVGAAIHLNHPGPQPSIGIYNLLNHTPCAWRAEMSSRLAVKASRAFEEKLDRILDDPEMLDRTPIREFVLAYQVTLDQQRTALAACPSQTRTTRVHLRTRRAA